MLYVAGFIKKVYSILMVQLAVTFALMTIFIYVYVDGQTYHTVPYNTIQYNTIPYNTIQYNTIQYNTIQYNTIQYNTIKTSL